MRSLYYSKKRRARKKATVKPIRVQLKAFTAHKKENDILKFIKKYLKKYKLKTRRLRNE